jgi:hypothetical protein
MDRRAGEHILVDLPHDHKRTRVDSRLLRLHYLDDAVEISAAISLEAAAQVTLAVRPPPRSSRIGPKR